MFTGLIKEVGKIESILPNREGAEISVKSIILIEDIEIDDSIAINGVCQTATYIGGNSFRVQAVHTTLDKTTLGKLKVGDDVNMELAMRPIDRLGGHLVQGHVNGIASIVNIDSIGNNYILKIKIEDKDLRYIVKEGSITLDGISLTVAYLDGNIATVSIIPHTWKNTILKNRNVGDLINYEVDVIAKYVERLLGLNSDNINNSKSNISEDWLRSKGF